MKPTDLSTLMDESQITIRQFDFEELIMDSVRYTIGRMTYAPHIVCEIINKHMKSLSKGTLSVIKRDIEDYRDRNNLGHSTIDAPVWIATLENIEKRMRELDSDI